MQMQICYSAKYSANSLRVLVSKRFLRVMKFVDRNNGATGPNYTTAVIVLAVRLTGEHRFTSICMVCRVS